MSEYTILSIDDDPSTRVLFEMMLSRAGFDVVQAEDADEAVQKLQEIEPDLIMTDIQLPGKNGIELIQELRQRDDLELTAIVVLSAFQSETMIDDAKSAGADEFIKKPLKMEGLANLLIGIIKNKRGE